MKISILLPENILLQFANQSIDAVNMSSFGLCDSTHFDLVGYMYDVEYIKILINRTGIPTPSSIISREEFQRLVDVSLDKMGKRLIEHQQIAKSRVAIEQMRQIALEHKIPVIFGEPNTNEGGDVTYIREAKARDLIDDISAFLMLIETESISDTARKFIKDISRNLKNVK